MDAVTKMKNAKKRTIETGVWMLKNLRVCLQNLLSMK